MPYFFYTTHSNLLAFLLLLLLHFLARLNNYNNNWRLFSALIIICPTLYDFVTRVRKLVTNSRYHNLIEIDISAVPHFPTNSQPCTALISRSSHDNLLPVCCEDTDDARFQFSEFLAQTFYTRGGGGGVRDGSHRVLWTRSLTHALPVLR